MSETARPLRIVRVIARLNIGGPALHAALLTERLQGPGVESVLVVGQADATEGDLAPSLAARGLRIVIVPALRQPLHPWRDLCAWWRLLRILQRERPDIVHTHTAKAGALGRAAAMTYNALARLAARGRLRPARTCRTVHTFHGHVLEGYFPVWLSYLFAMIERWLARGTDRLIAVSPQVQRELLRKGIGRPPQWRVIPVGLELSTLARVSPRNEQAGLGVGFIGRLVPIKNPGLFLKALRELARQRPEVPLHAVIAGDGPLRARLEAEARQLGLGQRVRFAGWQHDLPSLYEALDAACLTSWNEGTPVALIEAMAAGRAVVATDVGGVRSLLDDTEETESPASGAYRIAARGLLVRPGDVAGLSAALERLARDPQLRARLGEAGRAHVMQRYTPERLVADLMGLYRELQAEGSPCMH